MPGEQLLKLQAVFDHMKQEPMPVTREEFENRAILYHVLMDLEEFLFVKQRFYEALIKKNHFSKNTSI